MFSLNFKECDQLHFLVIFLIFIISTFNTLRNYLWDSVVTCYFKVTHWYDRWRNVVVSALSQQFHWVFWVRDLIWSEIKLSKKKIVLIKFGVGYPYSRLFGVVSSWHFLVWLKDWSNNDYTRSTHQIERDPCSSVVHEWVTFRTTRGQHSARSRGQHSAR